ncbi:VapC toxin family PIN domain ribonuclease [Candidatus Poribacteria bacterium]|nr:VapC toxin family PIN domain ribonuclease [Candidatus Poribacteria bacterium]
MARQRRVSFPRSIRERFVLTDSSAFLALADDTDRNHELAVEIYRAAPLRGARFFTTDLMVVEAHALILSVLGHSAARRWLRNLEMGTVEVTAGDQARAREIIFQYTDKDFS